MQRVAAYALFANFDNAANALVRYEAVTGVVESWISGKGDVRQADEGMELALRDGRLARYEIASYSAENGAVTDWTIVEPSNNALVQTRVSSCITDTKVCVYIELQAAGGAYQLGPMRVDIRCPTIVRSLVKSHHDWHVGDALISAEPYVFEGEKGAIELEEIIWHPSRNLPVIVASDYDGSFLTESFPADLASELVGVAIVATVDADAAWCLTSRRGKAWSCFNGAVRLYWPLSEKSSKPEHNPLWLRDSLLSQATNSQDASGKIRRQMRRQLLGLSAFSVPEPEAMDSIRAAHVKAIVNGEREALRVSSDWEGLANSYAESNDSLVAEVKALRERNRALEADVANLQQALQWRPEESPEIAPDLEVPPATIAEAVDAGGEKFVSTLTFGSDVTRGVAALSPTSGPPEKVLRYLGQLSEMVLLRRTSELGTSPIKWLQERGVDCSGESQTIKNSASERQKRTWNDGQGLRFFEMHLKPTEATHPDRCVRIYFDYDEQSKKCIVGWVGRHP